MDFSGSLLFKELFCNDNLFLNKFVEELIEDKSSSFSGSSS
jgi:hypothetical protein